MEHDDAQHNAIVLDLSLPTDDAKDYFKDFMQERYDASVKGGGFLQNRTVLSMERTDISALHNKAMDLFARFEENKHNSTRVLLIGRDGYDLYFSTTYAPDTYQRLVEMMRSFNTYALEAHYKALLTQQQDDLKDLVRAQEKRTKTVNQNKDEQKDNRKRNKQLEEEIRELEQKKVEGDRQVEALREDILRSQAELPVELH